MAIFSNFHTLLVLTILFLNFHAMYSTSVPTISASPAVLPYVDNAPNMSSFFPSPSAQQPVSSAVSPNTEAFAPVPSSGEFVGRISSAAECNGGGMAVCFAVLCALFVSKLVHYAI
ncbi:hypothetical protein TIFTF001_026523 [Ficus carica]|uniref:Transmembrane protein n=1 Tax=Ficus carica TaxID=3494 RepID=A0AA88DLZ8_FICCA|nr:hypothetical protein TIFTF001_026523 [Ficus carica]